MTEFDATVMPNLNQLLLGHGNQSAHLTTVNLKGMTKLKSLYLGSNTAMKDLDISETAISNLDTLGFTGIKRVTCNTAQTLTNKTGHDVFVKYVNGSSVTYKKVSAENVVSDSTQAEFDAAV